MGGTGSFNQLPHGFPVESKKGRKTVERLKNSSAGDSAPPSLRTYAHQSEQGEEKRKNYRFTLNSTCPVQKSASNKKRHA